MSIVPKLIALYRNAGYEPVTGHNPHHFSGWPDAPFTKFIKNQTLYGVAGLALQEVMFLEGLAPRMAPKRILVIGNAYGWSTIALSLIFPDATVAAIDPGEEGNALTNLIAKTNQLPVTVETGYSPQGVAELCDRVLGGAADLILIDAIHTNEAVLIDYEACKGVSHDGTVVIFHDVINWDLIDSVKRIISENDMDGYILTRTPSGMAITWKQASDDLQEYVKAFTDDPALFKQYPKRMISLYVDKISGTLNKI